MNQTMGAAGLVGGLAGPLSENAQKRRERLESYFHRFREEYPMYAESVRKFPHATPKYPENLRKVNLSKKRMAQVKIPEPVKSVICGTCLGDSSLRINPKYANARIQNRHSSHQYSWFFWKWLVCCREYTNGINSMTFQNPDGYSVPRAFKERASRDPVILDNGAGPDCAAIRDDFSMTGKLKVTTKAHKDLTNLHSIICPKNKEKIERSWLNHMTNYFLMVIWLDDGSLYNNRQGRICLDFFPKEEQQIFADYLKAAWGIETYVKNTGSKMKDGRDRHRIIIKDYENLFKLLRVVAPLVPVKEMLYKVTFVPVKNKGLLQRWASEVVDLVLPEFREYMIEKYDEILKNSSEEDIVHF